MVKRKCKIPSEGKVEIINLIITVIELMKFIVEKSLLTLHSVLSILAVFAMTSCADKYSVSGTSLQNIYGANMAYLRSAEDASTVDSCEIVHGKFSMNGILDSVQCVQLVLGNMNVPVILEQGDIQVSFANSSLKVGGTPLNDKFFSFLTSRDSLTMLVNELPSKQAKLILNGVPEDDILRQLGEEEAELRIQLDQMDTDFITGNYDNILGTTWWLRLAALESMKFGFPTTNPMLDELYGKAPEVFRQNKDINEFMDKVNGK